MTSFISEILANLQKEGHYLPDLTFILPSKRAGAYLKMQIAGCYTKPVFSPAILSIEEFAEELSELKTIDTTATLFEFYSVYLSLTPKEQAEDFENFSNWAQTLIHDFNEIDRYLVPPDAIFNYLSAIKDNEHWSLQDNQTDLVKNYLSFWRKLPEYYTELKSRLLIKQEAYQGLVYRQASEKAAIFAKEYAQNYVFIGFNALNSAEQLIFQQMLDQKAKVFWDIDRVHFEDQDHDVSLFIRKYAQSWPYYQSEELERVSSHYRTEKQIEIIGIPKSIGQAKYAGEILSQLTPSELNSTAVVLGDEGLLLPILNAMPQNIDALNITMGYPLKYSPFSSLFEKLFDILKAGNENYYHKDVISVFSNSIIMKASKQEAEVAIQHIKTNNLLYLSKTQILELFTEETGLKIAHCFPSQNASAKEILVDFSNLIKWFKAEIKEDDDKINMEFLYHYHLVVEELLELVSNYPHIKSVSSLHHFFKELISTQTLDFQGKPFQGLQLMGMLESRVLDFDTVILTSVDEGTLPAGKSNNSFIPFELKKTYNLPTYKEKDAVYTYHFYHLLQRAKKVYLLHNTDTDSNMGGEKSRFLIQLEIDNEPLHNIKHSVVIPEVPAIHNELQVIQKTPEILEKLKQLANRGFSPSALTTYIRNPLDFYKQYILGIRDKEEVEETVAYNTLGTIVHDTLEKFYKEVIEIELSKEHLEDFIKRTPEEVEHQFHQTYSKIPLSKGKNLLILEVVKRYVTNFLKMEIKELAAGRSIKVKEIETKLTASLNISELDYAVNIGGMVDRVDISNDILRIIDYKTGKVIQSQLEITNWEDITTDYDKYSKPFQVLMYALILLENQPTTVEAEAGVISFKNLKEGFLKFGIKESQGKKTIKNNVVNADTLLNFKTQLKKLILEICDPETAFYEKEIKAHGNY